MSYKKIINIFNDKIIIIFTVYFVYIVQLALLKGLLFYYFAFVSYLFVNKYNHILLSFISIRLTVRQHILFSLV